MMSQGNTKKILFLSDPPYVWSGYGTQIRLLGNQLADLGWQVYSLGLNTTNSQDGQFEKIRVLPNKTDEKWGNLKQLLSLCQEVKPDVILSLTDFWCVSYCAQLPDKWKKRWVHWLPIDTEDPRPTDSWQHEIQRVPWLVYLSDFGRKKMGIPGPIIPHGIDMGKWIPSTFKILTVSRNGMRKRYDVMVDAIQLFSRYAHNWEWTIRADPFDKEGINLEEATRNAGIRSKVNFVNAQEDLRPLFWDADLFLLLTGGEGFGIILVEALAAGLPLIVTDTTTSRELCGEHATYIPVKGWWYWEEFDIKYATADVEKAAQAIHSHWRVQQDRHQQVSHMTVRNMADMWDRYLTGVLEFVS